MVSKSCNFFLSLPLKEKMLLLVVLFSQSYEYTHDNINAVLSNLSHALIRLNFIINQIDNTKPKSNSS